MRISKKLVAVGVIAGTLAVAGAGYAYWTSNGEGSASATTSTAKIAKVTAVAGPDADAGLWPGGPKASVHFTVDNENPYPVQYTSFAEASVSDASGDCDPTDFTIDSSGLLSSPVSVGANNTAGVAGSTEAIVSMKATAGDACQGAKVTVSLKVAGTQVSS